MKPVKEGGRGIWEGAVLFHIGTVRCSNMEQKREVVRRWLLSLWWISEFSVIIKLNERILNALKFCIEFHK